MQLSGVRKSYGQREVLRGVSFTLEPGTTTVLVGPSGAGKTTLLRVVAGLEPCDGGKVSTPPKLGMVFQDLGLFPHLSVLANVRYTAGAGAREILELVGFSGREHDFPGQLSGGERQRVALARALGGKPSLLLLDEPFLNLDPPSRRRLLAELARLKLALGLTILYVTHYLEDALLVADQLLFLYEGQVELAGPIPDVLVRPASPAFAAFAGFVAAAPVEGPAQLPAGKLAVERCLFESSQSLVQARNGETLYRVLTPGRPDPGALL